MVHVKYMTAVMYLEIRCVDMQTCGSVIPLFIEHQSEGREHQK